MTGAGAEAMHKKIEALKAEIAEMESSFTPDEDPATIVKNHIKLLHQYNEQKDIGQLLIGKVAGKCFDSLTSL